MKAWLLLLCFAAPAHADLYRWVDPESGSVKLSSLQPSDPTINAEVVSYKTPAAPKPPAVSVASKPAAAGGTVEALQARFAEILAQLTSAKPQDFNRAGEGIRQHIEAYEAVRVELDRLDPAGAARRRSESTALIDKLKQGFAAQFGTTPPGK
ncbi:MAG TPA: DUF4124 domain-containing protein [Burkholderiales bacterium]|nr:DUF4124 domain-containing protein [Burkholderiales bacterium]